MGVEANDSNFITPQEENDVVLEPLKEDYKFDEIKDTFDEGIIHGSLEFCYVNDNDSFVKNVKFLNPSSDNREFVTFLLSDLGRNVMTSNRLSIHIANGDIFYENHNAGNNIYTFLMDQQNENAAFILKKFAYRNTFEKYINSFLAAFSIDGVEKYDLFANKNSKYLFYRFSDYVKAYGSKRRKIRHSQKLKDPVGLKRVQERNKQFLIEKIIHSVEFHNPYTSSVEQKPEITNIVENNYKTAICFYQDLYIDIADFFQEFIKSLPPQDIQDMDDDIKSKGLGVKNILDVENSLDLMNIFQIFDHTTGRLPLGNGLLTVPEGDAPAEED